MQPVPAQPQDLTVEPSVSASAVLTVDAVTTLPGGGEVLTTMKDVHGASMATITAAFLAALCGAFIMHAAQSADRRLVVAGYAPSRRSAPGHPRRRQASH